MQFIRKIGGTLRLGLRQIFNRQKSLRLLRRLGMRQVRVRIGKYCLWVNLQEELGQYLYVHQRYEPFETSLIEQIACSGMTAVDIGANIGYYTIILASRVGKSGRVIAFEPDPNNVELLSKNLRLNRLTNVTIERTAVLHYEGEATLYLSATNHGDHRVFDAQDDNRFNDGKARSLLTVRAITLDAYLKNAKINANLVKMDVQGAEMMALRGMTKTLSDPTVILLCEFWPYAIRRAGGEPKELLASLKKLSLILYEIVESNQTVVPVQPEELSNRFSNTEYANLICIHQSREAKLPFLVTQT